MKPGKIKLELNKTDPKGKKDFLLLRLLKDLIDAIGTKKYTTLINIILIETQKSIEKRNYAAVIASYENL